MKRPQGGRVRSVGTARNYQQRLVQIAARLDVSLTALTPAGAVAYLQRRAAEVGQKTLDMERQAMQAMMLDITLRMAPGQTLPVVRSTTPQQLKPRAYSPAQVRAIVTRQDPRNALATEIVYASGIRAHELLTLGREAEQPPDDRRGQSRLTGTAAEGRRYAKLAAKSACTHCGRRRAMPGESRCSACAHQPPKSWPRLIRAWYIETVGGCEFGPYGDEIEAHADAVYARTELDGTPDLDDIRTRLSFEIG